MSLPNPFPGMNLFVEQKIQIVPGAKTPEKFKPKKAGTKNSIIFLVVDESGSMSGLTQDTIGGINTLITEQAKDTIPTNLTIVKFEGGNIRVPIENVNVKSIKNFSDYRPAGGTNLLDAIGFTLNKINEILTKTHKEDRPSVFVQIITDGYENSSRKFSRSEIAEMIKDCEKADWIIGYVGANVDAFAESSSLGISSFASSGYNAHNTSDTYSVLSSSLNRTKGMRGLGMNYVDIQASVGASMYTDEEIATMNGDKK